MARISASALVVFALVLLAVSTGTTAAPKSPLSITDVSLYAWYWNYDTGRDEYRPIEEFPAFSVSDDPDSYPTTDVVATIVNRGGSIDDDLTVETALTYQVGPRLSDESELSDAQARRKATWRKPEWTRRLTLPSFEITTTRRLRAATFSLSDDLDRFEKKNQWPYRARLTVIVRDKSHVVTRAQREVKIYMLD